LNQATALESADHLRQALPIYLQVWQANRNPIAANNAAYIVSELDPNNPDKLSEARNWIDEAVSIAPNISAFRDTKGWITHLQNQPTQACEELQHAIKGLINSAEAHYHVGMAQIAAGHDEYARWHLDAAVDICQKQTADGAVLSPADAKALKQTRLVLADMAQTENESTTK
jgi:hypothetical protein